MYLTKIPELSANYMYSVVNVYMIVNQWDAIFDSFRHESTWIRQARNHDFISGK